MTKHRVTWEEWLALKPPPIVILMDGEQGQTLYLSDRRRFWIAQPDPDGVTYWDTMTPEQRARLRPPPIPAWARRNDEGTIPFEEEEARMALAEARVAGKGGQFAKGGGTSTESP